MGGGGVGFKMAPGVVMAGVGGGGVHITHPNSGGRRRMGTSPTLVSPSRSGRMTESVPGQSKETFQAKSRIQNLLAKAFYSETWKLQTSKRADATSNIPCGWVAARAHQPHTALPQ